MRTTWKTSVALAVTLACLGAAPARAIEILTNGSLDQSVGPLGWMSNESITGETTAISLAEHVAGGQSPLDLGTPALGVTISPWAGNTGAFEGQNKKVNYTLEQTITSQTAGQQYHLSGDFFMDFNFSGIVTNLDPLSPSDPGGTGTVPSPTIAKMELIFMNGTTPIGAPATLDLRAAAAASGITGDWATYTLEGTSPANTNAVKVKISALDMVDNFTPQGFRLDNFSLKRGTSTAERLTNANLNQAGAPLGWDLIETPEGTDNSSFIGFAHHPTATAPTGQGLWVRAFEGGEFSLTQTKPAVAGGAYTFTGWSFFEQNYIGGVTGQTTTETFLKLEFLDASNAILSTETTDIAASRFLQSGNTNANDATWREHTLMANAPAGSVNVRISVGATGLGFNVDPKQSAFFDDFSLQGPAPGVPGDWDNDLDVDGNDFLIIQRGLGTTTTAADIATWKANFGTHPVVGATGAVPEPASFAGAAILALAGLHAARRRQA